MRSNPWRQRRARKHLANAVESLERRRLLSAYYDYDILAEQGNVTITGDTIASFLGETSINDHGRAAFVANVTGANGNGRAVIATPAALGTPVKISFANPASGRNYDVAQINNDNRVVTTDSISGARLLRTWDANNPGNFSLITRTDAAPLNAAPGGGTYDIVQLASRAEDGETAYIGFTSAQSTPAQVFLRGSVHTSLGNISGGGLRISAGNGGRVVTRGLVSGTQAIVVYNASGNQTLASATVGGFSQVSQPGISDDGQLIAFAGVSGTNSGIWLSYFDTAGAGTWTSPTQVAGLPRELGYDAAGNGIQLNAFDLSVSPGATLSNRVGVVHRPAGAAGIEDDVILLSYIATPSAASRANPHVPGATLLFSANRGLWTTKVIPRTPLRGIGAAAGAIHFNQRTSPLPVVQIGDMIGGQAVTDVFVYDPIATATRDQAGAVRANVADADHYVLFRATTAGGDKLVRAAQFDTDSDGLYDHWERAGEGIDIDLDGTVDLNLNAIGANPNHKDLFLEIDWLRPDAATGRNFAPQLQALTTFVALFNNNPLTNPDGVTGVTVHIDAGPAGGLSQNMGTGSLQGGDLITQGGQHIHVLYMGNTDPLIANPGTDAVGRPWVSRSMENAKNQFFGTTDKKARELAFRYAIFADAYAVDATVAPPVLDGSSGIAESPYFNRATGDFRSAPGNDLLVTLQGRRSFTANRLAIPLSAPPATIPEPVGYVQAQTLAHELGHTLGLLHGGFNMTTSGPPRPGVPAAKPNYRSLMNYAYQLNIDTAGVLVRDYAGAADAVFNDYAIIDFGFAEYFDVVGNTLNRSSRGADATDEPQDHEAEFSLDDAAAIHGPFDDRVPTVQITSPAAGAAVAAGGDLIVDLTASDNAALDSVTVSFDVNGDGTLQPGETVVAASTGGNNFRAVFNNVSGGAGQRTLTAVAADTAAFTAEHAIAVNVNTVVSPPPKVTAALFHFDTLPHQLRFTFSADVSASLAAGDFFIRKSDGTSPITPSSVTWEPTTSTAAVSLPGITPDGRYIVTLSSAGISTAGGGLLDGDGDGVPGPDFNFPFLFLRGDVNNDGTVNFDDLAALAQNYNKTGGMTFDKGDFNFDGNVNFDDLALLAQRYNTSLPPIPAGTVAVAAVELPESSTSARRQPKPIFNATVPVQRKKPPKPLARRS